MVTVTAFVAMVALLAIQRLAELRRSARHERRLRARGAVEHAPTQVPWMRLLHAAWLCAMPLEVIALDRPLVPWVASLALAVFLAGQALRWAAMRALGERWTVRVLTLPGVPPVTSGIYRWLRHPNYLGVSLEIVALPLFHGAWITSAVFGVANAVFVWRRVRVEEAALDAAKGDREAMGDRPRLMPRAHGG
jgi:methyltransferase